MNFSNRMIVFLLGLSVGLLIGAGFFIFKIDDYLSKMEFFKSTPDTVKVITESKDIKNKSSQTAFIKSNKKNSQNNSDSAQTLSDSLAANQNRDSVPNDTII